MMFMGAMMLIVLPIFLVVSARLISQKEIGQTAVGKVLEAFLYVSTGFCLFGLLLLLKQMFGS